MSMGMWSNPMPSFWSVGAPVGAPVLVQTVPSMDDILAALTEAYGDLTLQCAVASLGHYVPAMTGLPGLEELHRQNYEVSYHLTTAIGSARRILAGSREPGYFALVITCERAAREHQQKAQEAFRKLSEAAPADLRALLQRLHGHIQATMGHIQRALGLTTAAFGPESMDQLLEWSRQVERA
jgi:hypothetical protein